MYNAPQIPIPQYARSMSRLLNVALSQCNVGIFFNKEYLFVQKFRRRLLKNGKYWYALLRRAKQLLS